MLITGIIVDCEVIQGSPIKANYPGKLSTDQRESLMCKSP